MPLIYLRHLDHGTKIATMEMEAEYDESNGWVRFDPDTPSAPAAADVTNGLVSRRRGRPPRQQQDQMTDGDSGRTD